METDGEMDEVAEPFFGGEIDFDYEFDAAMYYDFTRPETKQETREAEDWFKFAGSYPPSRKHLLLVSSFWRQNFVFLFFELSIFLDICYKCSSYGIILFWRIDY